MKVELIQMPLAAAISMLADIIDDIAEVYGEVVSSAGKPKSNGKSVPAEDRIKIPPRIVNDCKKAVKEKKENMTTNKRAKPATKKKSCPDCKPAKKPVPAKKKVSAAPLFTADEQRKILSLRRKGFSLKAIGKAIKRRDKSVAAFLKSAAPAPAKKAKGKAK